VADPSITGSDSIATLTHRLTVFVFPDRIITVHRVPLPLMAAIDASFDRKLRGSTMLHLQNVLVKGVCKAYLEELTRCVVRFDSLEARLFSCTYNERTDLAHDLYHVKRRAAVYSRLLGMQHEAYSHLSHSFGVLVSNPHYQDVIQSLVHARTMAEDLNDNAQNVLQLVFQISSYQLNELMRVLTRFSAFFIPLSFITSVWGMNFPDLPLVESEHGLLIWCVGVSMIATFLLLWFKWRAF
jgi:magnesium transporter